MFRSLEARIAAVTIAASLFMGSATTIVAHEPSSDLSSAVRQCLDSHDQNSDYCANAIALSGMSSVDFWPMVAFKVFDGASFKDAPKEQPKPDLFTLLKACAESHDRASAECAAAQNSAGLSDDDFWAKMQAKFGVQLCDRVGSSDDDESSDCWQSDAQPAPAVLDGMVKDCFAKFGAALSDRGTSAMANEAGEVCGKAVRKSGLSPRDFFAKYGMPKASRN